MKKANMLFWTIIQYVARVLVSGFPIANRREARKLGLLRQQKFRS
jgi:hypothetical protein